MGMPSPFWKPHSPRGRASFPAGAERLSLLSLTPPAPREPSEAGAGGRACLLCGSCGPVSRPARYWAPADKVINIPE